MIYMSMGELFQTNLQPHLDSYTCSNRARAAHLVNQGRCASPSCPGSLSDPRRSPRSWGHCRLYPALRMEWKVEV